jgi:hypothetical protein
MSKISLGAFAVLSMFAVACDESPATTVERSWNCDDICDEYKKCYDNDYNVDDCHNECTAMKDADETDRIDDCAACIEDKSCTGNFACADECLGIVP